jgi:hypothetical protein
MATPIGRGGGFVWPPELATFDPDRWPYGRAEWHLARSRYAPDKLTKYQEICAASRRDWLDDAG